MLYKRDDSKTMPYIVTAPKGLNCEVADSILNIYNFPYQTRERIMGGFFCTISKSDCVNDLFYGTDYNSHLGTKKGGIAVRNTKEFKRSIHNLESSYFRTKFEPELGSIVANRRI
jgi:hypothetical protein